jgi:predicted RNase H-like HicB family nuclease
MTTKIYTARCVRSGDWWAITVPQVRGVYTQARRLSEAEGMAREAIALVKGVPADSFDVTVAPDLPTDLAAEVDAARELRETADRYQREATAAARAVAGKLVERYRLPLRDIGRILGLSHQRIGQLLAPPPETS